MNKKISNYLTLLTKILGWLLVCLFMSALTFCAYIMKAPSTKWLKDNFLKNEQSINKIKEIVCRSLGELYISEGRVEVESKKISKNDIELIQSMLKQIDANVVEKEKEGCNVSIEMHGIGFAGEGEFIYYSFGTPLDNYKQVEYIEQPKNSNNKPYYEAYYKVFLKKGWYIRYISRS